MVENTREWFEHNRKYYFENLENECVNCGSTNELHLHHIVPIAKGGTNKLSNIAVLCVGCHSKVHNIDYKQHSELTRLGMETARLNGKQIGGVKGKKLVTKKSVEAKKQIQKYSKEFDGTLKDHEVMKLVGVARNSYYKYKKELMKELGKE